MRLVADGAGGARPGYQTALDLADAFFDFWDQHRSVLQVVDLSTDEGDRRFRSVRVRLLDAVTTELAEVIAELAGRGQDLGVDPLAEAGVLVTMLAHVAAHHIGFEFWGIRTADVRVSVARHVFWGTTGQRPPT